MWPSRPPPASCRGRPTTSPTSTTRLSHRDPRQRRTGPPVHPGVPAGVGRPGAGAALGSRPPAVAGGGLPVHAGLRPGRRQQLRARGALPVPPVPGRSAFTAVGARRCGTRRVRAGDADLRRGRGRDGGRARRPREQERRARHVLLAPPSRRRSPWTPSARFSDVSPQAALAYRFTPDRMAYVSVAQGFKAGGFNAASPAGSEAYGEEHAWNLEAGLKTSWAGERVSVTAAVFRIGWDDMQLNTPNPLVPGQFYIANVGAAHSSGVEVELNARPAHGRHALRFCGVHARPIRRGQRVGRRGRVGPRPAEHARLHHRVRRAVLPAPGRRRRGLRPGRRGLFRRVSLRRVQRGGTGGLFAGQPARRRARPPALRRGVGEERVRHPLHPGGVRLRRPGASPGTSARWAIHGRSASASASGSDQPSLDAHQIGNGTI